MTTFQSKVTEKLLLGGSFQYIHLELISPNKIEFQAGQYIIITIDKEKGIRRDYSIASAPSMSHAIDIVADVKPEGEGSKYLSHLAVGDTVEFAGPFGCFVISPENSYKEILFVATGSGISPIRSMIDNELVYKRNQKQMRLWWGMRYEDDCYWIQDFDELEEEHPNFEWDLVLSKPPEDWPLHSGYVTKYVLDYIQNRVKGQGLGDKGQANSDLCVYLCGSRQMILDLSTELTKSGITSDQILHEKFF